METKTLTYEYDYKDVEQFLDDVCEDICGKNNIQIKIKDNQYIVAGSDKVYQLEIYEWEEQIDAVYKEIKELPL